MSDDESWTIVCRWRANNVETVCRVDGHPFRFPTKERAEAKAEAFRADKRFQNYYFEVIKVP